MANPEHLAKLKEGVAAWNQWREKNPELEPDLSKADLKDTDLKAADLKGANLEGADLLGAYLVKADLRKADLRGVNLRNADLDGANLESAYLLAAYLGEAYLRETNLVGATLSYADLSETNLRGANFEGAILAHADLRGANFGGAQLKDAKLARAKIAHCSFGDVDLSVVKELDDVEHRGPSTVGIDTIGKSKGKIPDSFLHGCGISPWEIEFVRLYDPDMSPNDKSDIFTERIFPKLTEGPLFLGGIFISYSHADSAFVDNLFTRIKDTGAFFVWLDRHELEAGDLQRQVERRLREQDIVILVLSKKSIESDWVEYELEKARELEKEKGRDVLCPIALDDSWKKKINDVLWRQVKKKNVLDFSEWKTDKFDSQFVRLINGIKKNYELWVKKEGYGRGGS